MTVRESLRLMRRRRGAARAPGAPSTDPAIRAWREARRRRRLAVIPSLFTLANAVCGFAAIVQIATLRFDPAGRAILNPENLVHAAWLILLAIIFDGLDGRIARFTKSAGDFGGELDSLCDAVTFGVAPGLLVAMVNAKAISAPFFAKLSWLFGLAFACGAILRLARFNVENSPEDEAHDTFKGLPSPAAAGTIATLALFQGFLRGDREIIAGISAATRAAVADAISVTLPFLALALGYLMVSTVRYVHLPNRYLRGRKSIRKIARIVFLAIVVGAIVPEIALALGFLAYALSGPIATALGGRAAGAAPAAGTAGTGLATNGGEAAPAAAPAPLDAVALRSLPATSPGGGPGPGLGPVPGPGPDSTSARERAGAP